MVTLPPALTKWILVFAPLFSKRVWQSVQVLLAGAILAVGSRTVTAILRVMGLSQEQQFQKFHRVLNRAKWSALAGSRRLLFALIDAFIPEGPLLMALDDTIERRRGAKISAKGIYRDPVRSSHSHFVKASGLRWLCLMLLAPIPWAGRCRYGKQRSGEGDQRFAWWLHGINVKMSGWNSVAAHRKAWMLSSPVSKSVMN